MEMEEAAVFFGYTRDMWDATELPPASPVAMSLVQAAAATMESLEPESDPAHIAPSATDTDEATTPEQGRAPPSPERYYNEYWVDLPRDVASAFAALGYDEAT